MVKNFIIYLCVCSFLLLFRKHAFLYVVDFFLLSLLLLTFTEKYSWICQVNKFVSVLFVCFDIKQAATYH